MKPQTALISTKPLSITEFWDQVEKLMNQVRERAYAIFENRGRSDGHDLDDWLQAETELLKPVPLEVNEANDTLNIRVEVPDFKENELEVNLDEGLLTITGEHRDENEEKDDKKYLAKRCTQRIFRRVLLPAKVISENATATLKSGVLEISVPKAEPARKLAIRAA